MKLNIWVIEDWLKEYQPILTVTDGAQEIEGIRFLSNYSAKDAQHIYISRSKDYTRGSGSEEILLTHGNDVISLRSIDIEEVFSKVTECFEFYNNWEKTIFECAKMDRPEQRIVDASENMFGPIFIVDLRLNLIAYSRNYMLGEINTFWDEFIQLNKPSLKSIHMMNSSNYVQLLNFRHHCYVYEEPHAAPYSYGIMVSYCDKDDNLIGQCALCTNHPITKRELCLAQTFETAILAIRYNTTVNFFNNFAQSLLIESLSTGALSENDQHKLWALMGWEERTPCCILLAGSIGQLSRVSLMSYLNLINTYLPDCIGVVFRDRLVFCTQTNNPTDTILSMTDSIASQIPVFFGVSYVFSDLSKSQFFFRQATIALEHGMTSKKSVTSFRECALYILTHNPDREFNVYCLHPTVILLKKYDNENNTEYCLTLRTYLQFERSYLLTAQHLFVHRNTILYRIEKIHEVCPMNLEDPEEREYILFSFRFLD